jgi:hypothetical protein
LKSLDEISSKGLSYIQLIDEKMVNLKDIIEPIKVIRTEVSSSEIEPINITPVSVSDRRTKQIKKNKNKKAK